MHWVQLTLETNRENAEFYSEWLTAAGAVAVTLQDSQDQPLFEPTPGTTPLWNKILLMGLFDANTPMENIKHNIQLIMDETSYKTLTIKPLEDQNWTRAWMDQFHPMRFGKNLWICPSFSEIPDPTANNIQLDPGMAFGTGTHPTTRLCLEWLDANPPIGNYVLDYGCGSGILGIAALKLGASFVYAVDNDPQALESTLQNAKQNNYYENRQISAITPDSLNSSTSITPSLFPEKIDLLLANILANPLIELAPSFADFVRPNGILVLSGILENQLPLILDAYQSNFNHLETVMLDEWVRVSFTRK